MDKIFTNPSYNHISEEIIKYLDYDSLISLKTYFDSKSIFSYLDYPKFWLKKCQQENISEQLFELWKEVIDKTEFTQYEHIITDFLMKILRKPPGSFQSPLHMAAKNGEMALVWNILQIMAKEKIICQFDDFENSPIHEAARFGHVEIINILAPFANNANAKDAEENTPFDVASIYGQSEVVKFLLLIGQADRSVRCLI